MSLTISTPDTAAARSATTPARFRDLLDDLRADCVQQREQALAETATSMPDPVAMRRAATLLRTTEEIDAALRRITDGHFGVCTHCRSDIPVERLEFRPYAATCVACHQSVR
jgi:RNA polymerase-binding transcription factor DksA